MNGLPEILGSIGRDALLVDSSNPAHIRFYQKMSPIKQPLATNHNEPLQGEARGPDFSGFQKVLPVF